MAGQRPIRAAAIAALTALGGGLIAFALIQLIPAQPAGVSNSAVELTAADVSDVPALSEIFGTEIPAFQAAATQVWNDMANELNTVIGDYSAALHDASGWAGIDDAINGLNQGVLNWMGDFNNTVEDLFTDMGPNVPSVCNILTDLGRAGNGLLGDMNQSALDAINGLNTGMNDFFASLASL